MKATLVSVLLVVAALSAWWVARSAFRRVDVAAAPAAAAPGVEKHLQDGRLCRVDWLASSVAATGAARAAAWRIALDGRVVRQPADPFAGLADIDPSRVDLADFGPDVYVTVAGGGSNSPWQARFTIRDDCLVERTLFGPGRMPQVTTYAPPAVGTAAAAAPLALTGTVLQLAFPQDQPISRGRTSP